MINKRLISLVIPVFNEEENVELFYQRLCAVADNLNSFDFEFIFTDNNSQDATYSILEKLAEQDSRIRVFSFSRNFGYQRSILLGYQKARGDAAIEFDCDGQDPPELLQTFLNHWQHGYQIVYGIRKNRKEGFFITELRKMFYRFINSISDNGELPLDAGDFMLIDRKVLDQLKLIDGHYLYLRGTIFNLGFKKIGFEYSREARLRGESKFPLIKMIELAMDGIVNQSIFPLRLASYTGIFVAVITILLALIYLTLRIFSLGNTPQGFTTSVLLQLAGIGINATLLGIIGEYIARVYVQSKNFPTVIVDKFIDNTRLG